MSQKHCTYCKKQSVLGPPLCGYCGKPFEQKDRVICHDCSEVNFKDKDCCEKCGSPLELREYIPQQIRFLESKLLQSRSTQKSVAHEIFEIVWKKAIFYGRIWFAAAAVALGLGGYNAWRTYDNAEKSLEELKRIKSLEPEVEKVTKLINDKNKLATYIFSARRFIPLTFSPDSFSDNGATRKLPISDRKKLCGFNNACAQTRPISLEKRLDKSDQALETALYIVLPDVPVTNTVEIQYGEQMWPPTAITVIHNLLVVHLTGPATNLKSNSAFVRYFPDLTVQPIIKTAPVLDEGRIYVNELPLPNFYEHDPGYKSNELCEIVGPDQWQCPPK